MCLIAALELVYQSHIETGKYSSTHTHTLTHTPPPRTQSLFRNYSSRYEETYPPTLSFFNIPLCSLDAYSGDKLEVLVGACFQSEIFGYLNVLDMHPIHSIGETSISLQNPLEPFAIQTGFKASLILKWQSEVTVCAQMRRFSFVPGIWYLTQISTRH